MRVAVVVCGTRGDVQPMLALAVGLRSAGHSVVFCASADNGALARSRGCGFEAIGEPLEGNPSLGDWGFGPFNRFIRRQLRLQVRDLPRVVERCDLVVASGLAFGVRPVAERRGIAYRYVSFVPAGFLGTTHDPIRVRVLRGVADRYADLVYGRTLSRARASLGLPGARGVMRQLLGPAPIAATDAELTVLPPGVQLRVTQTGYPMLASDRPLSDACRRFLDAGPAPVYVGFGSMPVADRRRMGRLLLEVAERSGERLVISRGWAGIEDPGGGDRCLLVDDEPHDLLFPAVSAVVHHGGAGTVATAARAGVPQIVLPQAADQFLWREQVESLGVGPRAPMLRRVSASSLAVAIGMALGDHAYRQRAQAMAGRLRAAPDGVSATVSAITGVAGTGA